MKLLPDGSFEPISRVVPEVTIDDEQPFEPQPEQLHVSDPATLYRNSSNIPLYFRAHPLMPPRGQSEYEARSCIAPASHCRKFGSFAAAASSVFFQNELSGRSHDVEDLLKQPNAFHRTLQSSRTKEELLEKTESSLENSRLKKLTSANEVR